MFLSCRNKPIENANLLAGAWRLTLSVKLCRRCHFLSSRPFSASFFGNCEVGAADFSRSKHCKMDDHYVLLLQRVIDENTRLREAIEARDNEQKRVLEELSAKLESNSTSTPARTTGWKRKRTITVSPQCRVSVVIL